MVKPPPVKPLEIVSLSSREHSRVNKTETTFSTLKQTLKVYIKGQDWDGQLETQIIVLGINIKRLNLKKRRDFTCQELKSLKCVFIVK